MLANSRLEVRNHGFGRLTMSVGVDDSAMDADQTVIFAIYGDGRLLATSTPLQRGAAAQKLEANVSGVKLIELVARFEGTLNERLPVSWADAAFLR